MDGLKLINPEFDFEFGGKTYKVRKATLEKVILFQTRFNELATKQDAAIEKKMAGYCIFLILQGAQPQVEGLTEEWVTQNMPDAEFSEVVLFFGFMNGQKVELLRKVLQKGMIQNSPEAKEEERTGGSSSTS